MELDKYFIVFSVSDDIVITMIYETIVDGTKITYKHLETIESPPKDCVYAIMRKYRLTQEHINYLETEAVKIKDCIKNGTNYVQE